MSKTMPPLLPCPFCGNTPFLTGSDGGHVLGGWFVSCDGCGASQQITPAGDSGEAAIEAWNRRAAIEAQGVPDAESIADRIRSVFGSLDADAIAKDLYEWLASAPPAPQAKQPKEILDAIEIFERLCGRDDHPAEAMQACKTLRMAFASQAKQPLSKAKIDDFKHWLNARRSLPVSECFHEIVACYEAAANGIKGE